MLSCHLSFFDFPYDVQIEIISHLSLKDVSQFAETCSKAQILVLDKVLWKKILWNSIKAVKFDSETMPEESIPKISEIIIHDDTIEDLQKLCAILEAQPNGSDSSKESTLAYQSLLGNPTDFSGRKWNNFFLYLLSFFTVKSKVRSDPITIGKDAPSFLFFGPPETKLAKKLMLTLIASKGPFIEPIGLVKGKPGGIGGGVTVNLRGSIMNFIPVRRARRAKLVKGEGTNATFHQDVIDVAKEVDGLVYYFDSKCHCYPDSPYVRKPSKKNPGIQCTASASHSLSLSSDLHELQAMLRSFERGSPPPPVLILMANSDASSLPREPCSSSSSSESNALDQISPQAHSVKHRPFDLISYLMPFNVSWLARNVYMPSLEGVSEGFNWFLER